MNFLIAKGLLRELDKMEFKDIPKNSVVLTNISYTTMLFWPEDWAMHHHSLQNKMMEAQRDQMELDIACRYLHRFLQHTLQKIANSY